MRRFLQILLLLGASSPVVLSYGSGTSASTHLKLANVLFDAAAPSNLAPLVLGQSEYPDMYKFKQPIVNAANDEEGHHDPTDTNTRYWYGSEGLWENVVRASQYPTGAFYQAYQSIGNIVHVVQDRSVPAHDRVIFHGFPSLYYVAPGGKLLDPFKYPTLRSDGFEFVAGDYDLGTLPVVGVSLATFHASPGAWSNTPQYYNSASETCRNVMRKLWLCSGEAASPDRRDDYAGLCSTPQSRSWGVHSFPEARGCAYPPVGADLDWYPRRLYPTENVEAPQTAHEMGRAAVYLAIKASADLLKQWSKSLPPVVLPVTTRIDGDVAGGAASTFSLQLHENRTQGVYLAIRDIASGRHIRATVSGANVPAAVTDLDGTTRILLAAGVSSDLTTLPWTDRIQITWDGSFAGGAGRIGPGSQTLGVEARDDDGNVAIARVLVNGTATATCAYAVSPTTQAFSAAGGSGSVTVTTTSGCAWTAASNATFLAVESGLTGVANGTVTYRVVANAGIPRSGTLTVAGKTFTVTQTADPGAASPFGSVDTPTDGATGVAGSIGISGWALDDRGVTAIRLLRDPVGSEPAGQRLLLGYAAQVPGARPDIAKTYRPYPLNDRAGWGYLLLTNMLPNQGNGTYTIYVYADDADGNSTLLGTRRFTAANQTATRPFGAIDTPAQGETISGSAYVNFGWVVTPLPKSIPTDGSTIMVLVDGMPAGRPTYNQFRADIATLFPGLANSNGAIGAFVLDTTKLANGLHTIEWVVTDSSGAAEGIGSRYFTVQNGAQIVASR